jgi:hypothetical protein
MQTNIFKMRIGMYKIFWILLLCSASSYPANPEELYTFDQEVYFLARTPSAACASWLIYQIDQLIEETENAANASALCPSYCQTGEPLSKIPLSLQGKRSLKFIEPLTKEDWLVSNDVEVTSNVVHIKNRAGQTVFSAGKGGWYNICFPLVDESISPALAQFVALCRKFKLTRDSECRQALTMVVVHKQSGTIIQSRDISVTWDPMTKVFSMRSSSSIPNDTYKVFTLDNAKKMKIVSNAREKSIDICNA